MADCCVAFRFIKERVKPWYQYGNSYVAGTPFYGDTMVDDVRWGELIAKVESVEDAEALLQRLNGSFAIYLQKENFTIIAVDRLRTIPLFYSVDHDSVTVYDHVGATEIQKYGICESVLRQLEISLFVTGAQTYINEVKHVCAGAYVLFQNGEAPRSIYYFDNAVAEVTPDDAKVLAEIDALFVKVFSRLIQQLNGRRAVIPLSGGHDSRLILYYLKSLGYDNVITYTYGKKDNFESVTSKQVADYFGVEWHFVEYHAKELSSLYNAELDSLVEFYCNGISALCVQEWYAVKQLKEQGILHADDVIVPGHSFDAVAGSFVLPYYAEHSHASIAQLLKDMIWKHYSEGATAFTIAQREAIEQSIREQLPAGISENMSSYEANRIYDLFNFRERQAKYTCNAVRMYEYYGFDWCMPLWDYDLIEYWGKIPLSHKFNRALFVQFTEYKYGELMRAAPVQNLKTKKNARLHENLLYRVWRKIGQILHYTDFHYCFCYIDRPRFYRVLFKTGIMKVNYHINLHTIDAIKKILRAK